MMKRLIAWSLGLILIMTSIAFAERTGWTCPQCNTVCKAVQNFCISDGQPAPWVWTCSECGTERNTEDKCRNCGKTQDEKKKNRLPVVGDIMTFGHYHQTPAGNDSTPIEWYVLDVQGNKAMLLSRYALEYKENENGKSYYQSWNLRKWMNEDFFTYAFTDAEQTGVITTNVDNGVEQTDKMIYFGPNTEDCVFLLSYHEVSKYITNSRVLACAMTQYAEQQMDQAEEEWYWFLRSPSSANMQGVNRNYCINADGTVGKYNCVKRVMGGVRPALWLDLSAEGWMIGEEKIEGGEVILWESTNTPTTIPAAVVSPGSELRAVTQYRYRDSFQELSNWSSWSGWSTSKQSISDSNLIQEEQRTEYSWWAAQCKSCGRNNPYWGYACLGCGTILSRGNFSDVFATSTDNAMQPIDGRPDGKYLGSPFWYKGQGNTEYRYRTRSYVTKWTDWSAWSENKPNTAANREIEERTVYR